jgi:negative regulator of replication initiation
MQNASNLASMNSQFGPAGGPRPPGETDCDSFNDLMGILSGAYDGTLDYIDRIIGDISSFINQSGIGSLLSNIISAIAGAGSIVADVISAIVGVGIQLLGGIIGVVAKVINAIADITSAIANEINNIANMAAELLRKALALVLGGAALDPCKRAVLMNTGSTEMKAAVTQLNQPLGTAAPGGVGTTVDPRANADEVTRNMKYARDEAKLNPGVPQSPFEESASNYTTKDESLHADATQSEIPVLRGNLETVTTSSSYTYIPTTPSPELARKVGESMEEFLRRSGVTSNQTTAKKEKGTRTKKLAKSAEKMINDWRGKQLDYTRDSRALISSMNDALKKRDFPTKKASLSNRLKVLVSLQTDNQKIITNLTNKYIDSFYYTGGSIILNENRIDLHYLGRIYP